MILPRQTQQQLLWSTEATPRAGESKNQGLGAAYAIAGFVFIAIACLAYKWFWTRRQANNQLPHADPAAVGGGGFKDKFVHTASNIWQRMVACFRSQPQQPQPGQQPQSPSANAEAGSSSSPGHHHAL
ncbi:uncharacterized protein PG986_015045 [Apiospora aurea]|uniref:Transmembrane protein n=1 Tax=Apiospora aurea TaxID=335848 RepID=A0ABR1PRR8_9PEZI